MPNTPKDVTAEVAIITPKSDRARDAGATPDNQAPIDDRDNAAVTTTARDVAEPVQTETPKIEAPDASDEVDAQTGNAADRTPQTTQSIPLTTSETAPEQALAEVDVESGNRVAKRPGTEGTDLEKPATEAAPITLAMNMPKVETSDKAAADELPGVSGLPAARPDVALAEPSPRSAENMLPTGPVVPVAPEMPAAKPVIALSKPVETPITSALKTAPIGAPEKPGPEPKAQVGGADTSDQLALSAPELADTTPDTPKVEAQTVANTTVPQQVEAPQIDAEPEAPIIRQASVAPPEKKAEPEPKPDDASTEKAEGVASAELEAGSQKTLKNQVVDRRNPPAPSFEGRAFDAFAATFAPPNDKPFLTIILEHVGEESVNMYDLLNFGQPITFGINTSDGLAKWRENEFRRGGFEVVALVPETEGTGLSEDMDDRDIPKLVEDYLTAVPGAVAVLDAADSDLYRNPRKVTRISEELRISGRGLLIHEKFGVNRALEAARSADVPAASLLRVIDGQRDAASIRRALDKAALDASKTGATIVFGRTYPETIAAILPWLLGNSARSVTLAPLTSTMTRIAK